MPVVWRVVIEVDRIARIEECFDSAQSQALCYR